MKPAATLVAICCAMAAAALAQQPAAPTNDSPPPPADATPPPPGPNTTTPASVPSPAAASEQSVATPPSTANTTPSATTEAQGAREMPLDAEPFDARVHRRIEEYAQRHQQRERQMASYDKAGATDAGLERYADPRKVQVELDDELDREQTSEELAGDHAEQARNVQTKAQALQDFIARRRQMLDDLNRQDGGAARRQELEVALANLARQPASPETLAEMREIDRRLSEVDRNGRELPAQLTQAQQEATDAAGELDKLRALEQSYERQSRAFTADALSAHQNRLRLASRLEFYVVRAQAEDELEQGRKAMESVQHLPASPEVERTLNGSGSGARSDAELERLRGCIQESGDVKGCRERARQE